MNIRIALLVVAGSLSAGAPLAARPFLRGRIRRHQGRTSHRHAHAIEWTNPHSYFHIDVKEENGSTMEWTCEAGAPGGLSRRGFKRGDIKIGDTLSSTATVQ